MFIFQHIMIDTFSQVMFVRDYDQDSIQIFPGERFLTLSLLCRVSGCSQDRGQIHCHGKRSLIFTAIAQYSTVHPVGSL